MKIKNLFKSSRTVISFEVFPPKSENPLKALTPTLEALKKRDVDFVSVTYGAGGSSKDNSIEIASEIKNQYGIEVMAHLTCVCCNEKSMEEILMTMKENNIENVLALRGDFPQGYIPEPDAEPCFKYAKDLVSFIKKTTSFGIAGAAYPEGHLECPDMNRNIEYLKMKVDSGVEFLVTQLFFHNDNFYDFYNKAAKAGIKVPMSAGIMPILNARQIKRITSLCGAKIPDYLMKIIDKYEDKPEVIEDFGIEYACKQIQNLKENGIQGIHVYTMNKDYVVNKIMDNILLSKAI